MKTVYRCDICGNIYDSEERCKRCEDGHCSDLTIANVFYERTSVLPTSILVKCMDTNRENGAIVKFRAGEVVKYL